MTFGKECNRINRYNRIKNKMSKKESLIKVVSEDIIKDNEK